MTEVTQYGIFSDSGDGVGINRPDVEPGPDIEATSNAETGGTMFEDIEPWPQGKVPFILASHLSMANCKVDIKWPGMMMHILFTKF